MPAKLTVFNLFTSLLDERRSMRPAYSRALRPLGVEDERILRDVLIFEGLKAMSGERRRIPWWREFFRERGISPSEPQLEEALREFWLERVNRARAFEGAHEALEGTRALGIRTAAFSLEEAERSLVKTILERTGLANLIDNVLYGQDKRSGELGALNALALISGLKADEITYVEAILEKAILARNRGYRVVWLCLKSAHEVSSLPYVTSLKELPKLLARG